MDGGEIKGEDWCAEELGAARFVGVTFTDVDLTEATTSGAHFEDCTFHQCHFNCSVHDAGPPLSTSPDIHDRGKRRRCLRRADVQITPISALLRREAVPRTPDMYVGRRPLTV